MYTENLVPKRLEVTIKLTIGNFHQEFVDNWFTNLKQFSIVIMKQIVAYCDKAEQKTQKSINGTEKILKQQLKKED